MADEIRIQAETGQTIKALILLGGAVWDGSALVDVSTLTDAEWTAALVAVTEEQTSDTTGVGAYFADWPGGLTQAANYDAEFFLGAAPSPGDLAYGFQGNPTGFVDKTEYTLTADERDAIAEALLDLASTIDSKTVRETLRYLGARLVGKLSGAGTTEETIVGMDGATDRATFTVSNIGEITDVDYDP
jgi:hypothetical protein